MLDITLRLPPNAPSISSHQGLILSRSLFRGLYHELKRDSYARDALLLLQPQAGDALFIPCGWWHQIDSPGTTIAVNFWWSAPACEAAQSPAAAFLLRESLRSLTHSHMTALLSQVQPVPAMKTDSVADGDESGMQAALSV